MNKTKQFRLLTTLFCLSILADVFVSCDSRRGNTSTEEAVAMIQAASQKRDYNRILTLADSLEKSGDLSLGDSYFWQGYAYYRMPQVLTAEFYWKEAADTYQNLESYFTDSQTEFSLENIHKYLLKKYKANANAGNKETADLVANNICGHLDSAVNQHRNGAEPNDDLTMMCVSQK